MSDTQTTAPETTTALQPRPGGAPQRQTIKDVMGFLSSPASIESLKAACTKHLTPDRLLRIAGAAISRQPKLLECTRESLFVAVSQSGQTGLETNLLGEAYLVPFRNRKTGRMECQFMPGYRGLVKLARRSGEIATVEAHVVHERDKFSFAYGDNPRIEHVPYDGDEDPGRATHAYAVCVFKDGSRQRDVMSRREIEAIRARSQSKDSGPWVTDYEEMCKKTVVRRLCKMLPLTIELADALERDTEVDLGSLRVTDPVTGLEEATPPAAVLSESAPPPETPRGRLRKAAARAAAPQAQAQAQVEPEPPAHKENPRKPAASDQIGEAGAAHLAKLLDPVPVRLVVQYLEHNGSLPKGQPLVTLHRDIAAQIANDPAGTRSAISKWLDGQLPG